MKRLIGVVIAATVLLSAGIAQAGFMYYLQPVAGSGYTVSGNGSSGSGYSVSITSSSVTEIPVILYAAVQTATSHAGQFGWYGEDYLGISNLVKSGGTQLNGTFDTTNGSQMNSGQSVTGTGVLQMVGDENVDPVDYNSANPSWYNGAASSPFYGGPLTGTSTLATVGGVTNAPNNNISTTNGWQSYICVNGGTNPQHAFYTAESASGTSGVSGSGTPNGSGWIDIPLGTLWYEPLTPAKGQSTQLDVHQAYTNTGSGNLYYGAYQVLNSSGVPNAASSGDQPVTITYNVSSGGGDASVLAFNTATASLGRILQNSAATAAVYPSSTPNVYVANTGTTAGGYSLTTGGSLILESATTGSVGAGANGSTLAMMLNSASTGAISGTLTVANTGSANGGTLGTITSVTVSGAVVANRPFGVPTGVPSNARIQAGYSTTVTLNMAGADASYTDPNLNQVGGVGVSNMPNANGVFANGTAAATINAANPSPTVTLTYNTPGTYSTAAAIDLATGGPSALQVITPETNLFTGGSTQVASGLYTITIPAVSIVQSRPLGITATTSPTANVLTGSIFTTTISGGAYADASYTVPTVSALTNSVAVPNVIITSAGGSLGAGGSVPITFQYTTQGSAGTASPIDLTAAGLGFVQKEGILGETLNAGNAVTMSVPVVNVGIGNATTHIVLTGYGPTSMPSGGVLAASLGSTLAASGAGSAHGGGAVSLYGLGLGNAGSSTPVSLAWSPGTGAYSDIAAISGLTSGTNFAIQMQYDTALMPNPASAAAAGKFFLGYMSASGWSKIGNGNGLAEPLATLVSGNGNTLTGLAGDWGYSGGEVWAVLSGPPASGTLNYAAVPEPGTLALLAAAGMAAGLVWARRKRA
jgi:hypothetical protein